MERNAGPTGERSKESGEGVEGPLRRAVRRIAVVAFFAVEGLAEGLGAACFGGDPGAAHPGGVVADVLVVSARQLRDPVLLLVLVKADDGLAHGRWGRSSVVSESCVAERDE